MKFNDAYRTVFEKRKKNILLKSPTTTTIHSKKKKMRLEFQCFYSSSKTETE